MGQGLGHRRQPARGVPVSRRGQRGDVGSRRGAGRGVADGDQPRGGARALVDRRLVGGRRPRPRGLRGRPLPRPPDRIRLSVGDGGADPRLIRAPDGPDAVQGTGSGRPRNRPKPSTYPSRREGRRMARATETASRDDDLFGRVAAHLEPGPLLEATPECLVVTRSNGQIVYANHRVQSLTGFTRDELVVTLRDLSELQAGRDAQFEAEAKYRALVEHIPAVVYLDPVDEDDTSIYVSPQIRDLIGIEPDEWLTDP